jgi:hypothetical protein
MILTRRLSCRRLSNASLKGFIAPELGQLNFLQELYVLFHCDSAVLIWLLGFPECLSFGQVFGSQPAFWHNPEATGIAEEPQGLGFGC